MAERITFWDHERIAALNPGLNLPHRAIVRVVREDASGTSEAFTRYLAASSPVFQAAVAVSQKPSWSGRWWRHPAWMDWRMPCAPMWAPSPICRMTECSATI